jgi:hypothetical protein
MTASGQRAFRGRYSQRAHGCRLGDFANFLCAARANSIARRHARVGPRVVETTGLLVVARAVS